MPLFEMNFGSPVMCEGDRCGDLEGVALNAETWEVSHLIVGPGLLKHGRVIPLSIVEETNEEGVILATRQDKLEGYPVHKKVDRLVDPESGDPVEDFKVGAESWRVGQQGMAQSAPESAVAREEIEVGVPEPRTILSKRTPVHKGGEDLGRLRGLTLSREDCKVRTLTMDPGLLADERGISIDRVAEIGGEGVYLKR